jgi:hypothetical protein
MLRSLCFCAGVALALLALAGCGVGPQATATPAVLTATPAGSLTPAPIGATPLPVATMTPGATAPTAAPTPPGSPTAAATSPTPATGGTETITPVAAPTTTTGGGAILTETPMMADETPTAPAETPAASPTGAAPPGGTPGGVTIEVISFNVWQDFMPGPSTGGPPLLASVEVNVTNNGTAPIREVLATRIVVRRPDDTVVLDRGLQSTPSEAGTDTPIAPGEIRHYSYRSASSDVSPAMTENEAVSGSLTLSFDGIEQTVPLPATRVLFTR